MAWTIFPSSQFSREAQGVWYFDTALGKQEIMYRRIGENELKTIDALHAILDAEKEYYSKVPADLDRTGRRRAVGRRVIYRMAR